MISFVFVSTIILLFKNMISLQIYTFYVCHAHKTYFSVTDSTTFDIQVTHMRNTFDIQVSHTRNTFDIQITHIRNTFDIQVTHMRNTCDIQVTHMRNI